MLHVVLVEPEIAPNVGNIARTCAATKCRLHLVGPLAFRLDDRSLHRAGVDYWEAVDWVRYKDWEDFTKQMANKRMWLFTARGGELYHRIAYQDEDCLVFGCESRGLPASLLAQKPEAWVRIPILHSQVRSLNLATAVGIAVFRALESLGRI